MVRVADANILPRQLTLPSWYASVEYIHTFASSAGNALRATARFATLFTQSIPESTLNGLKATKILAVGSVIFAVPKLTVSLYNAYQTSDPKKRIDELWHSAVGTSKIVYNFTESMSVFRLFGVVGKTTWLWTEKVAPFTFPLVAAGCVLGTFRFAENHEFYKSFRGRIKQVPSEASQKKKFAHITKACKSIIREQSRIEKVFEIPKSAKIAERAKAILDLRKTNPEQSIAEADRFFEALRRRADVAHGFALSGQILTISSLAISIISVNTPPNPVTISIAAAVYSLSFAHLVGALVMKSGNPFEKPTSWHRVPCYQIQQSAYKIADLVDLGAKKALSLAA